MPMISQKRKRPLLSTRIPPLPSQSRSTYASGAALPTFHQEINRPDILRQTYLSHTQSHSMGGATRSDAPQETSYQHRDAVGSQLDDTHNDLPIEAPNRKRSAVRHRHGSVNGYVPNLPDERLVRRACRLVKTNCIVRITQVKINVVIDPVHRRATNKVVHSLLACDTGATVRQHCPMNMTY
ncbi:hypothetical protein D8674_011387 [Pyrus ussuriensis x Pyrus communis]|uniref:Uncharacterized protein n=1 Tax=Pyrus ussuriensis x Pyrus communis TaxID=2448454 RepID=A0A5N5FYJ2_9ROSA|nr:hypothetical protein D8674_011387 [Pyrus ussuriensis x Pyrus communis]